MQARSVHLNFSTLTAKLNTMKFTYHKSCKVTGWGFNFDSLTELKYAISIMDEFEFIRPAVSIYYDVATNLPVASARRCDRRYTADFLIRHRITLEAWLIEIKPRAYAHNPILETHRLVAENYIRFKKYDWQYKVVFDDEITLTEQQLEDFECFRKIRTTKERMMWFGSYRQTIESMLPHHVRSFMSNSRLDFILFGILTKIRFWNPACNKNTSL